MQDKILFIDKCEKSFELIHPSVLNISGFSIEKPYLYYEYIEKYHYLSDVKLTNKNILKIFLGIASGLSYLLSKGYYFSKFSHESIIFDEFDNPKLFDYINFENSNKMDEKELIIKYTDILNIVINTQKEQKPDFLINDKFISLIQRTEQKTDLPSFNDFIQLYSYKENGMFDKNLVDNYYSQYLRFIDKFIYNEKLNSFDDINEIESIDQIYFYFYSSNIRYLTEKNIAILNYIPDYRIKEIYKFNGLFDFTKYHDILKDLKNDDNDPFTAYLKLKDEGNGHYFDKAIYF